MSEKNDFHFISDLSREFFRKTHIKSVLSSIDQDNITGWEKWLQIEFAAFLRSHPQVRAWWRESKYNLDQRLLKSRTRCAVDFLVHQTHKHSHMAIELKQAASARNCIKGMLRDLKKIEGIKKKDYDIRSVWCIGVHKFKSPEEVRRLVNYHADELGFSIAKKFHLSEPIGRTGYSFSII